MVDLDIWSSNPLIFLVSQNNPRLMLTGAHLTGKSKRIPLKSAVIVDGH
jgi:hypothetical protein